MIHDREVIAVHCNDNKRSFFQRITKDGKIRVGKKFYPTRQLIGLPYGTTIEARGKSLVVLDKDAPSVLDIEEQEEAVDNRDYTDTNTAQALSNDEIVEMKNSGVEGSEIIKSLVENSHTWKTRSAFSKQKYLAKKQIKYMPRATLMKCTAQELCKIYFTKQQSKISGLREDALALILTYGNVHAGAQVLLVETCMGILTGAVADRLGGMGRVLSGFAGQQAACSALPNFNFDAKHESTILHFPFTYLSQLKLDEDDRDSETKPKVYTKEELAQYEKMKRDRIEKFTKEERDAYDEKQANRREKIKNRVQPKQVRNYLRTASDSLIIASYYDPMALLLQFFPLLGYSKPFVIFCEYLEPLTAVFNYLQAKGEALHLQLIDTWTRQYQVLEGRTHPQMTMNSASGYILTGIKVYRDAIPRDVADEPVAKRQCTNTV